MSDDDSSKTKKPKLQPEVDRGGSGRPPRKTAIGYFSEGEDDDSHRKKDNLKYGQKMVLKILAPDLLGFRVKIKNTSVEAILNTDKAFQMNILVVGIFKGFNKSGTPVFMLSGRSQENYVDGKPVLQRFKSETLDLSKFKYKRKSDSLPMSFGTRFEQIDFEETNVRRFITNISEPNFHGCIKFSSQQILARGYLMMMGGRCIGAEYSCASETFAKSTEGSIACILDNLAVEDAVVQKFNLSREIVYTLSSPFLAKHSWDMSNEEPDFVKRVIEDFRHGTTKTGMIQLRTQQGFAWAIFFSGRFIGFFNVETQTFRNNIEVFDKYLESSNELLAQTYVLPLFWKVADDDAGIDLIKFLD